MPILSVNDLEGMALGRPPGKKGRGKKGRAPKIAFLWESEDSEPKRYNLNDPEDKERYELDRAEGFLTGSERRARVRPGGKSTRDAVSDALADLVRPERSRSGYRGSTRRGSRTAATGIRRAAGSGAGAKIGKVVGTLAGRLLVASAIAGAVWWRSKNVDDQRKRDYVQQQIGKREAILNRTLSPEELAGMIDFYEAAYDAQRSYKSAHAAPIKTLR